MSKPQVVDELMAQAPKIVNRLKRLFQIFPILTGGYMAGGPMAGGPMAGGPMGPPLRMHIEFCRGGPAGPPGELPKTINNIF